MYQPLTPTSPMSNSKIDYFLQTKVRHKYVLLVMHICVANNTYYQLCTLQRIGPLNGTYSPHDDMSKEISHTQLHKCEANSISICYAFTMQRKVSTSILFSSHQLRIECEANIYLLRIFANQPHNCGYQKHFLIFCSEYSFTHY